MGNVKYIMMSEEIKNRLDQFEDLLEFKWLSKHVGWPFKVHHLEYNKYIAIYSYNKELAAARQFFAVASKLDGQLYDDQFYNTLRHQNNIRPNKSKCRGSLLMCDWLYFYFQGSMKNVHPDDDILDVAKDLLIEYKNIELKKLLLELF